LTGSPLTQTCMVDFVPGRAVIDAAHRKRVKYEANCSDIGYGFLPFSFSSLGELEKDAVTLLKRIRKFSMTRDIKARAAIHIFNKISFAIAKEVGASTSGWKGRPDGRDVWMEGTSEGKARPDERDVRMEGTPEWNVRPIEGDDRMKATPQ
ncbi:hypothetical protein Tco_1118308, partial [Tanacetum coccineum]